MKVPMKVLDYQSLVMLNKSSIRSGRKQNLQPDQMPSDRNRQYIINFHFEHEWQGKKDVRLSVIMEPGVRTAWLDVSPEEYNAIREVQMPELDWEAAVCVGIPPWTQ
jgi:hypothetical protein